MFLLLAQTRALLHLKATTELYFVDTRGMSNWIIEQIIRELRDNEKREQN